MTDNVTARLCLRGSPREEGDGGKARKQKAVIERRGEMLGGGEQELPEERVTAATDATPPSISPYPVMKV